MYQNHPWFENNSGFNFNIHEKPFIDSFYSITKCIINGTMEKTYDAPSVVLESYPKEFSMFMERSNLKWIW